MIVFGSPRRYIQGPGVLSTLGEEAARLGRSAVLIADDQVHRVIGADVAASMDRASVAFRPLMFGGEVTLAEIERLASLCAGDCPEVVVAAGGGKGIDTGKAVSARLGARLITAPTVASNDSSTSHVVVLYDAEHRLSGLERLKANPDVVIADTAVIARAPSLLLRAGIGDAIVKPFEANACARSGGNNMFGAHPPRIALAIAQACYETLRQDAEAALDAASHGVPDAAFERVVEACLLMSGLAFESGGLSIAHAMTRGLTAIEPIARQLHGLQVAYGLLVQIALDDDGTILTDMLDFHGRVGLPRSLADLGLPNPGHNVLTAIAGPTAAAPHTRNFARPLDVSDLVEAMQRVEGLAAQSRARQAEPV